VDQAKKLKGQVNTAKDCIARGHKRTNKGLHALPLPFICRVGQNRIYTVYDCIFGDFPAINTVYTPYTVYVWFWPTLFICSGVASQPCIQTT